MPTPEKSPATSLRKLVAYATKLFIWLLLLLWCSWLYACSGGDRGVIPISQWPLLQILLFLVSVACTVALLVHLVKLVKQRLVWLREQQQRLVLLAYYLLSSIGLLATFAILFWLFDSISYSLFN